MTSGTQATVSSTGQPALNSNPFFGLDVRDVTVLDEHSLPSPYILPGNQPFKLQLTMEFGGSLAPVILCCLCWRICWCFEVCCTDDNSSGTHTHPAARKYCVPPVGQDPYCGTKRKPPYVYSGTDTEAVIPAGFLAAGTYRLCVIVNFFQKCHDGKGYERAKPLAGFLEGPMIEITVD